MRKTLLLIMLIVCGVVSVMLMPLRAAAFSYNPRLAAASADLSWGFAYSPSPMVSGMLMGAGVYLLQISTHTATHTIKIMLNE